MGNKDAGAGDPAAMINLQALGDLSDLSTGQRWTSADLASRVRSGTGVLAEHGIGQGDRVMIVHGDSPAFFADLLAVWQRGGCAVCANPGSSRAELRNLIEFTEPTLLLVAEGAEAEWADRDEARSTTILALGADATEIGEAESSLQIRAAPEDPALILFTSGSTGVPKGVVHSFRSLSARLALNRDHIGLEDMSRSLCVLPTHFGHGLIGNCLTPLLSGCDLNLMAGDALRAAGQLGALIDEHALTFLSSVPAFWRLALKASKPPEKGTLRRIHIGSAPLSADLWRQVIAWTGTDNVVNMYGLTETANWVAGASARDHEPEDGLIGQLWGGAATVADDAGVRNPIGEGEVWLRTPSCMSGYLKQADLTGTVLQDGWFRTGDVGRIDEDGTMRLTGRKRTEINRAGIKVHPEEVDLLIERHPQVAEVCTFGLPDAVAGEVVAVAIKLEDGEDVKEQELRSWCSHQIRREARPDRWFFVSEIPRTERGKVNRLVVRQACVPDADPP